MVFNGKVACIGAGYWGKNLVRNFDDLGVLGWICDTNPEIQKKLSARYPEAKVTDSLNVVLEDPSVVGVAIATPVQTHGALVRRALEAEKDVLVEKPLCLSVAEGRELVALASKHGRLLMVGHLLWYHPAILKLRELVSAGELGRIQYIYSNRLNLGKIRREENILWSFAPHDLSVIIGLVGEMPELIDAYGGNYLHERIADVTVSILSFPSGTKAHLFVSWLHPFKEHKLVIVGDRKMAVFDDLKPRDKLVLYRHCIGWRDYVPVANEAKAEVVWLDQVEPLRAECSHFIECIVNRSKPRTDGNEALQVLMVLEACQRQLESRDRPIGKFKSRSKQSYFAHESAYIDEGAEVGEGSRIWHFSHIMKNARIGRRCSIGQNVFIASDVVVGDNVKIQNNVSVYTGVLLEDNVFCGPSMVFTNVINPRSHIERKSEYMQTLVKKGASLGANCTIVCGTTIGQYAFIGAGAVVAKDVPDYALVVGIPGRVVGWMCQCGIKLSFVASDEMGAQRAQCEICGTRYEKRGKIVTEEMPARTPGG